MERFRNQSGKSIQIWFRKEYGKHKNFSGILMIISVQQHVFYSFSCAQKTATLTKLKQLLNFDCEKSIYTFS